MGRARRPGPVMSARSADPSYDMANSAYELGGICGCAAAEAAEAAEAKATTAPMLASAAAGAACGPLSVLMRLRLDLDGGAAPTGRPKACWQLTKSNNMTPAQNED
jgi:hypothetical protein